MSVRSMWSRQIKILLNNCSSEEMVVEVGYEFVWFFWTFFDYPLFVDTMEEHH